jgi:tetratricopeptide (TPR) repeat protein/transcriptional regulator with XRE-family HTH domain
MPEKLGARNDLASALTVLRLLAGVEQGELATASGVSLSSIQKIELGFRQLTAANLPAILAGLGVDLATVEAQLAIVHKVRVGPSATQLSFPGASSAATPASRAPPSLRDLLHLDHRGGDASRVTLSLEESRRRAPGLWARLACYPHVARRALITEVGVFQITGLCELLCELSIQVAANDAQQALRLAELAVLAGERVPGPDGWCWRVGGFARFHLTNALRVGGRFQEAGEVLARAVELWQAGAAEDPGLLNEARVFGLEASLRRDQNELPEALALLDRALTIDRWGETPALLLSKARVLQQLPDLERSIAVLRQAAPQINAEREPRKLWVLNLNLALNLSYLGRHLEAEQALPEVRALAQRLGNQLDNLRVGWLEARVAVGLGRTAEAAAAFERVRAGFDRQGIAYDAALVTLELAELHASLGRTAEVKRLASDSAPIFHHEGVHQEAQRALDLFQRAAAAEQVTVELIRGLLAYLERARRDPQLRYPLKA